MKSGESYTSMIRLDLIRTDGGTQPRTALNQGLVEQYAEAMKAGDKFEAVVLFYDGSNYWLSSGFHRTAARTLAGFDTIEAAVRQGIKEDAQWHSYSANKDHDRVGLRRTNDDKERAVRSALAHPRSAKMSDRQIADHIGVSHMTVNRYRASICNNVTDAPATRDVTRNGKTFAMDTANIGTNPPPRPSPPVASLPSAGSRPAVGPADPPPAKPAPLRQDESTSQVPDDDEPVIETEPEEEAVEQDGPEQEEEETPAPICERVNGHSLPQESPAENSRSGRQMDPAWSWSKSVAVLYEQFGIVKKKGGIDVLIEEWEDDLKIDYLRTLKDIRERCDEYIPKLEKACQGLLLTTSSNS